jgi:ornithine decarboxylase
MIEPTERVRRFLDEGHETPFVVVDLEVVEEKYQRLRAALPGATLHYAVKANPAPEILSLLVGLGARFDVASPAEIEMCVAAGADPTDL